MRPLSSFSCDYSLTQGGYTGLWRHCSAPLSWTKPGVCSREGLASPPNICSCCRTPTVAQTQRGIACIDQLMGDSKFQWLTESSVCVCVLTVQEEAVCEALGKHVDFYSPLCFIQQGIVLLEQLGCLAVTSQPNEQFGMNAGSSSPFSFPLQSGLF